MIFGIGTDIVRVDRMQENIDRFGDRFPQRILTENELADYRNTNDKSHFLARRFAAKEATAKAMGIGFTNGLQLTHIGVGHNKNGKPVLEFSGYASEFLEKHEIKETHISLADERDHAVAFVTLVIQSS